MKPLFLFFLLCACLLAQDLNGTSGTNNASIAPSTTPAKDPRYIVEDEHFESDAGKEADQLAKEGKLVTYTQLAKSLPKSRAELALPAVAGSPHSPTELAETLRHSTVAMGLRYQEPHFEARGSGRGGNGGREGLSRD